MHMFKSRVLSVVVGAGVVVGAANLTAYAANGHPLLLGQHNNAGKTTSLSKSGKGPALSLHTKKKSPPFAVNSSKKVKHLNAAMVGGKTALDLETNARKYTIPGGGTTTSYVLSNVKPGRYFATFNVALNAATTSFCGLFEGTTDNYLAIEYGASDGTYVSVSGAAFFRHSAGQPLGLACGNSIYAGPGFTSFVTLSPAGKLTSGSVAAQARSPLRHGQALGR